MALYITKDQLPLVHAFGALEKQKDVSTFTTIPPRTSVNFKVYHHARRCHAAPAWRVCRFRALRVCRFRARVAGARRFKVLAAVDRKAAAIGSAAASGGQLAPIAADHIVAHIVRAGVNASSGHARLGLGCCRGARTHPSRAAPHSRRVVGTPLCSEGDPRPELHLSTFLAL